MELKNYRDAQKTIVYLDESGFKENTYRPYGYAPKGQRCLGIHNWQLKNTVNAIAAWCEGKLLAPLLYDRSINSDVFFAWVTQGLLPELPKEIVVVMDNATFHKREDIVATIEKAGHKILWLPPYSPDLNLIEEIWAWIKAIRKRWKMDDIDRLFRYFAWIVNENEKCSKN